MTIDEVKKLIAKDETVEEDYRRASSWHGDGMRIPEL